MSCNLKEILVGTFEECSTLVHIELSPNIESISYMSFARCSSLKEITLPKNLIEIGPLAFYMCALSKIELPSKVSVLGTSPFSGCSNIKVTSKNGLVESCGPFILSYWKQRLIGYSGDEQNIVIPTTVKVLLEGCLAHRKRTSDIRLPNTITHISKRAFLYCTGRSINIPSSVRYLGRSIYCIDKIYTTREQYLEFSNKEPRLYKPIFEVSDIRKIDNSTYVCTSQKQALSAAATKSICRQPVSVDIAADNSITTTVNADSEGLYPVELTLAGNSGAWNIYDAATNKYLAIEKDANTLSSIENSTTRNAQWTISISANEATIANCEFPTRVINYNKKQPRFSTYTTKQQPVQIYVLASNTSLWQPTTSAQKVIVYDLNGQFVRIANCVNDAFVGLPAGLYIVNGEKVLVR